MKIIQPLAMPVPKGHYSPGVVHNGQVYVSGQLPIRDGKPLTGPIEEQTECCLYSIKTILLAAGSDLDKILKVSIFIADINDWGKVNEVFARIMGQHRPARTIVPVKQLNFGCSIEMEVIASC